MLPALVRRGVTQSRLQIARLRPHDEPFAFAMNKWGQTLMALAGYRWSGVLLPEILSEFHEQAMHRNDRRPVVDDLRNALLQFIGEVRLGINVER